MFKYIICQRFKKFHIAVFSIAHPKYSNCGGNKEISKGWVCDNFPRQFHFFLGTFHEKHIFKYLKNLTLKVCKIWCNDVYMSILQIDKVDVQITKWLHLSFLFSSRLGRGEVVWGWLYFINSLQEKTQKTQTATQLYC
jgi:hypothetical protein